MWIVIPSTCSPSAPASAGSTLELSLQQAEALASSVTLSGKHSRPASWRVAWKRKPWLRHLSGATCEPSTAARGVESWIASLAATRANRSASPVAELGRTILDTFGRRSLESLRRLNPASCSVKTSAGTYHSGSTLFGTSFKEWATELRRDYSARRKSARRTGGSGCSSWPTTTVGDSKSACNQTANRSAGSSDHNAGTTLVDAIKMWPTIRVEDAESCGQHPGATDALNKTAEHWTTPQCHDTNPRGAGNRENPNGGGACLAWDAATWATPRTSGTNGAGNHGSGGVDLRTQVGSWPTPMAQDGEDAGSVNANMVSLGRAAKDGPTPGANDHKGSAKDGQRRGQLDEATEQKWQTPATDSIRSRGGDRKGEMGLDQQARGFPCSLPGQEPAPSGTASCASTRTSRPLLRARLNPRFVEWLMGWPHGWTDFAPVGTGLSHWRRRMRSCLCGLVWRSEP